MRTRKAGWILALAILTVSSEALAQGNQGRPAQNPFDSPVIRKYWNPIVGAGAVFEVTDAKGKKTTREYEILSVQTVDGKKAYWFEFAQRSPDFKGTLRGKSLIIPEGYEARRMILQFPDMAPMEMPVALRAQPADPKETARQVGSETITVNEVKLQCQHWRDANGADVWLSAKVAPLKLVKGTVNGQTWTLVKTIHAAKDEITGTVKPFDPDAMKQFVAAQNKKE
ncbi:MAG TPA: hypothetical protein VKT71_06835 [Candidatus Acidoferrales bacterium]|nr:hypothetical protein [Candidatus Acidoferrales bacterium]